jgi:hypothetical protein
MSSRVTCRVTRRKNRRVLAGTTAPLFATTMSPKLDANHHMCDCGVPTVTYNSHHQTLINIGIIILTDATGSACSVFMTSIVLVIGRSFNITPRMALFHDPSGRREAQQMSITSSHIRPLCRRSSVFLTPQKATSCFYCISIPRYLFNLRSHHLFSYRSCNNSHEMLTGISPM